MFQLPLRTHIEFAFLFRRYVQRFESLTSKFACSSISTLANPARRDDWWNATKQILFLSPNHRQINHVPLVVGEEGIQHAEGLYTATIDVDYACRGNLWMCPEIPNEDVL